MKTNPSTFRPGSTIRGAFRWAPAAAVALTVNLLSAEPAPASRSVVTAHTNAADFSYAGAAAINEGSRALGEISSFHARASTVEAVPWGDRDSGTSVLAGFGGQWFNFQSPAGSIVPDRLGAMWMKLGLEHRFESNWSARAEIDPGLYNDFARSNQGFDAPVALRLVYAANRDLQWVGFVQIDPRSGHSLVGGVGAHWKIAPDWTLSLLLPAPRLEWSVTPRVALFAGANLIGGTFRVADDFGRTRGRPALDGQNVDYREIAVGAGVRWQASGATTLHLSVGQMLDRRFEFHDRNLLLNGAGAAAVQFAVNSAF